MPQACLDFSDGRFDPLPFGRKSDNEANSKKMSKQQTQTWTFIKKQLLQTETKSAVQSDHKQKFQNERTIELKSVLYQTLETI